MSHLKFPAINSANEVKTNMDMTHIKIMDLSLPKRLGFKARLLIIWSNLIDDISILRMRIRIRNGSVKKEKS